MCPTEGGMVSITVNISEVDVAYVCAIYSEGCVSSVRVNLIEVGETSIPVSLSEEGVAFLSV